MGEILAAVIALAFWGLTISLCRRGFDGSEWRLIRLSVVAHLLSTACAIALADSGGGMDMIGYVTVGRFLAELMRRDFFEVTPEILKLLVHSPEPVFAMDFEGTGNPTGSMKALSAFVML